MVEPDEQDHIYVAHLPGFSVWDVDYQTVYEYATGHHDFDAEDDDTVDGADVTIMHKRRSEYVLNLSEEHPTECGMNRVFDCGHTAFGPPMRMPSNCPKCA